MVFNLTVELQILHSKVWCILKVVAEFFSSNACFITNLACEYLLTVKLLMETKLFFAKKSFSTSGAQKKSLLTVQNFELY